MSNTLQGLSSLLDKIIPILDQALKWIIFLGVVSIMLSIVFHVIGRYFFGKTYMGTLEFIRYAMIWTVMTGATLAFRTNEHVAANMLVERLSERNAARLILFSECILMLFLGAMLIGGYEISMRNMKQISLGMQIPMGWPYLAIPTGAVLMLIYTLDSTVKRLLTLCKGEYR